MAYYLVRTINGKETEVAQELRSLGMVVDQPTCRKMRRLKAFRRHKEVIEPVLPRYLFVECPDELYEDMKAVKHVISGGIVEMNRRDQQDVLAFLELVERGAFNHNGIYGDLKPGQIMRIVGGIFDEMHLSFERVKDGRMMGTIGNRRVEIDAMDAEKIEHVA